MNTKLLSRILSGIFLATSFSAIAAIPPAENLLPSDTLFIMTAPDCAAFRAAINQSPQWLMWNDPAMKSFHDDFLSKWNETFTGPLEKDLGVKFADFADLPQGQITFAVTQNGWDGTSADKTPGIVFLLDAKDKSDLLKTNLAVLQKKWTDSGKTVRTETVRNIKFSIINVDSNAIPSSLNSMMQPNQPVRELGKEDKPAKPNQIVFAQYDSLLIVGSSIEAVTPIATHLTGGSMPSLNDNAIFSADKTSQFRDSPLYYGWFNAKGLFSVLSQIPDQSANSTTPSLMPQLSAAKILAVSGLTGLKSASFSYRQSHDGTQVNFFLSVPESSRTGIFKMLASAPKTAIPPSFVPADAASFWRLRVDTQKSWETLQSMLGDISPALLTQLNAAISMINANAQTKDPNFDIRKNFIGNLGDDFISFKKSPTGNNLADLNNAPSLFLMAVSNPDQTIVAVRSLLSMLTGGRNLPEPRDFMGKKIYRISLPNRAAQLDPAAAPAPSSVYFASSGGYIAISDTSSIIEGYLRSAENSAKPLSATPGLIDAAQHVGGTGGGLFGYENQRETMRSSFAALKSDTSDDALQLLSSQSNLIGLLFKSADFSLLPDYDSVSKYLYFSVFSGSSSADGFSFKVFAPRPPGLN